MFCTHGAQLTNSWFENTQILQDDRLRVPFLDCEKKTVVTMHEFIHSILYGVAPTHVCTLHEKLYLFTTLCTSDLTVPFSITMHQCMYSCAKKNTTQGA